MDRYGPATYGDRISEVYDSFYALGDTAATVEFLASLAGSGPVLELGIGTGRIALPLTERGIEVHGIDASEAMVAKLRAKPGGADVPVTMGDFADVGVGGLYSLVFVVFNTFFALLTQEDQVRCMRNVAAHLADDGVFVLSGFVPDLSRFDRGQRVHAVRLDLDAVVLDVSIHNSADQRVDAQHVVIRDGNVHTYPAQLRYAWPSELDLMARLAGLALRERFGGWEREPFDSSSVQHVSVYRRG
jgi:SAM-dependent methyltransferase